MIDSNQQRLNMVESQVRPSDVTDRRIIRAMLEVLREAFAPAEAQDIAYMDGSLPVTPRAGNGERRGTARYLLAPRTFAKLVQLAEVEPASVVLDVGCATGYSTAVLARLAKAVVAVEVDTDFAARASAALRKAGVGNATVVEGPLAVGSPEHGPYDAVLLNGAVPEAPAALLQQLKDGGRLVAVIADGAFGRAQIWRRSGKTFDARPAFDAAAEPLPGFARTSEFIL